MPETPIPHDAALTGVAERMNSAASNSANTAAKVQRGA